MAIPLINGPNTPSPTGQVKRPEAVAPRPAPEPSDSPSEEQVREITRQLQRATESVAQNLQFMVDGETGKTVIRVVDGATKEVIRQIPSEEVLAIARAMDRLQGLLLKGKA